MSHTRTYDAIILKTYDVGEADRFCVILTRERGRLAARARGVRKPKSRMGGSILPLQRVSIDIHEGKAGMLITAVHNATKLPGQGVQAFMAAEHAAQLLLHLLEDDHALPEVFECTASYLQECKEHSSPSRLAFTIRTLKLLGLFPDVKGGDPNFGVFMHAAINGQWEDIPELPVMEERKLERLCKEIIG